MNTTTIEDVLKKHIDAEKEKHCGIVFKHDETIYAAMTEYSSLNRQGWTRVEDGFPEDGQLVLVYCVERGIRIMKWNTEFFILKPSEAWGASNINLRVTHWMPLPNKPEPI